MMSVTEALAEAISFQNEDTECLMDDGDMSCADGRCQTNGCMVERVNRWRAALVYESMRDGIDAALADFG